MRHCRGGMKYRETAAVGREHGLGQGEKRTAARISSARTTFMYRPPAPAPAVRRLAGRASGPAPTCPQMLDQEPNLARRLRSRNGHSSRTAAIRSSGALRLFVSHSRIASVRQPVSASHCRKSSSRCAGAWESGSWAPGFALLADNRADAGSGRARRALCDGRKTSGCLETFNAVSDIPASCAERSDPVSGS